MEQMKQFSLCLRGGFFWLISVVFVASAGAAEGEVLAIGEQRTLPVEAGTRFSVGDADVLRVKATQAGGKGTLLILKAKAQGFSDVMLLLPSGSTRTLSYRVVSKREALGTKQRLGLPPSPRLHPIKRLRLQDQIRRTLRGAGLEQLEVAGAGSIIFLRGDCASAAEKELAEELAARIFSGTRSHLRVPYEAGRQIRFRARILELWRSGARSFGFEWAEGVPGALQVSKAFSKAHFSLDAALKLLERRGEARTLSEPVLLLNERGVAELKVGGEIPVALKSRYGAAVQWKPYGFTLRLEMPGVGRAGARTKVVAEVSSLDAANGADGVPGLRTSRLETQVDLVVGRPVLLSGLMESRQHRSEGMLPWLGEVPVLGELFRSRDFQEKKSELVILLEAAEPNS